MGATQGRPAAMVAGTAPMDLRGTAYGSFNLISGLAMLASVTGSAHRPRFMQLPWPDWRGGSIV